MSADVLIYTGSLVNPELVGESPAQVKLDSWGMSLEEIVSSIVLHANEGKRVVRLHSGDPSIFGAIVEQIRELEKHDLECVVVPGVSSMFGAAAALQVQLTLGGVADTVIVTRPAGATLNGRDKGIVPSQGNNGRIFRDRKIRGGPFTVEYPPRLPPQSSTMRPGLTRKSSPALSQTSLKSPRCRNREDCSPDHRRRHRPRPFRTQEVCTVFMTDVVVSLPRFAEQAEKIADHLGADLCLYGEKEFDQLFRSMTGSSH